MPDIADEANDVVQQAADLAIAKAVASAKAILPGIPGDCDLCGEWTSRLVGGACAPCRDRYRLA